MLQVLKKIEFSLERGETLAIIGSSGSGKTTLLRCLNFLEKPDKGQIIVNGEVIFDAMDPDTQRESRCGKSAFTLAWYFRTSTCSPVHGAENVTLALELLARERHDYKQREKLYWNISRNGENDPFPRAIGQTGLLPHMISGGQQQRVAAGP